MSPAELPFRSISRRLVRVVVMVAVCCALAAISMQALYGIRQARAAFDASVRDITATRVPMLSTALWDIEPKLAQTQINRHYESMTGAQPQGSCTSNCSF